MGHILNMYKDFVACGLRIYLHNNKISIIVRYKYNIVSLLCVFYRLCCRHTVKPFKKTIFFIVKPTFFSKQNIYHYIYSLSVDKTLEKALCLKQTENID